MKICIHVAQFVRWITVALLGAPVALFAGALLWLPIESQIVFPLRSPLAAKLPDYFNRGSAAFSQRVHERFATVAREEDVIRELVANGFQELPVPTFHRETEISRYFELKRSAYFCVYRWYVIWRRQGDGGITDVEGHLWPDCV